MQRQARTPPPATGASRAPRASVGRADLLHLLALWGDGAEHAAAALAGYHWQPPEPERKPAPKDSRPPRPTAPPVPQTHRPPLQAVHYSVRFNEPPTPGATDDYAAKLSLEAKPPEPDLADPAQHSQQAVPPWQPLAPDHRLAVFAEKHLRQHRPINQWDVNALLRQSALGLPPAPRAARLRRPRWTGLPAVIHMAPQTEPLHDDYRQLARIVHRRSAGRAPVYLCIQGQPWRIYEPITTPQGLERLWRPLAQRPRLEGLGGLAVGTGPVHPPWPQGWRPSVWATAWQPDTLAPAGGVDAGDRPRLLARWDLGSHLDARRRQSADNLCATQAQVQALLALMSLAIIVHPPLLRALRCLLGAPAAAEIQAWSHADVEGNGAAVAIRTSRRKHYVEQLGALALPLRQQAAACIAAHHRGLSSVIGPEEALLAHTHAPGARLPRPEAHYQQLAWRLHHQPDRPGHDELAAYLTRAGHRADPALWQQSSDFRLAWAVANEQALTSGRGMPAHLPLEYVAALRRAVGLPDHSAPLRSLVLRQQDGDLLLAPADSAATPGGQPDRPPKLAQWTCGPIIQWRDGVDQPWRPLSEHAGRTSLPLPESGTLMLTDGHHVCEISCEERPRWALEWGRDQDGLYALAPNPWGEPVRVNFPLDDSPASSPLFALAPEPRLPSQQEVVFSLDLDSTGLEAGLMIVEKQIQNFRYLPPGRFLMGSPHTEPERENNEGPQHWVTLTEGLWLADTACTQGLWLAVMGGINTSRFKGNEDLPVDGASWDDVQQFLARLQALLPDGVEAVLPTEAQWEYACRAGTPTPFSFGHQITPDQVNYDGNYPYNGGPEGEYRRATVPVKALPANAWGLYQMHGNVWEWCADAIRDYADAAVVDPTGAMSADSNACALRGGSWVDGARLARSARRFRWPRVNRLQDLGFRFALRSRSQQGAGGPVLGPQARAADADQRRGGTPRRKAKSPSPKKK